MVFASGLSVPEGPVLLPDGSLLVVEMGSGRGCVTRLTPEGAVDRVLATTGRPNGLAVDSGGRVWIAESKKPSLLLLHPDGSIEEVLTACGDEPFLFPNDLAFGPDGYLYLTDSGILFEEFAPGGRVRDDWRTVAVDGRVYRIHPEERTVEKIDTGIRFTNGIAVGPDGLLYVNATLSGDVLRYPMSGPSAWQREVFGNVLADSDDNAVRGPDGMKFAADGDLYVTVFGQGDVTVLAPDGSVRKRIPTAGPLPTNLAFGPPGSGRIYVTEDEHGTVEVLDVGVDGYQLFDDQAPR